VWPSTCFPLPEAKYGAAKQHGIFEGFCWIFLTLSECSVLLGSDYGMFSYMAFTVLSLNCNVEFCYKKPEIIFPLGASERFLGFDIGCITSLHI